jgi:ribosomal protein L24
MASNTLNFQDRVKVVNGPHKGRVGQIAQTTPDGFIFGVRFGPKELHFLPSSQLMKLKVAA